MTETLDQRRFRDEQGAELVDGPDAQAVATFPVDAQVAWSWRYRDGWIEVEPFALLPARARRAMDEEAARLAAFHQ